VKRVHIITVVFLILTIVLAIRAKMLFEQREQEKRDTPPPKAIPLTVSLTKGKEGNLTKSITLLANIYSTRRITLSTKLPGYIESIEVVESQEVSQGERVVTIDSKEIKSNLESLKGTLGARSKDAKLAKEIYERNLKLYAAGGLAKEALDASLVALENKKALLKSTKEQIAQLKHQMSYLQIVAPFDAIVDRILLHKGDLAVVGKPIISLISKEQKLTFTYTPNSKYSVSKGNRVFIGDKYIGDVYRLYASAISGMAQAEVKLTKRLNLPTGSSLKINVEVANKSGCLIDSDALLHKSDGIYIMLYKDSKFVPTKIEPIMQSVEYVLVNKCPDYEIAIGSEAKLSQLVSYGNVIVRKGLDNEH